MRKAIITLGLVLCLLVSGAIALVAPALAGDDPPDSDRTCLPIHTPDSVSICLNGDDPPDSD